MFKKYYGKCDILGMENFDFLIEYRYALRKDKSDYCSSDIDGYSTVIIGREIVTGTPIFSMLPSNYASTVEDAAKLGIIKKGKLIAKSLERVSVSKMSNYLNQMTNEEAYEYIRKVNQLKSIYSEAIVKEKCNSNSRKANERIQKENLEAGKARVKRMGKTISVK